MPEHDLAILGSTMHYREAGAGEPIVFLHGNPTSSYLWRNVIPELEGEGRCLAPDLIGMGKSGKPALDYSFADHARFLEAWLDALGLDGVTLVLHDWGSALGFDWARRHPERVAGIAFMEAIVRPLAWSEWPEASRELFRAFRTPGVGETLILEKNVFVERVLPGSILRKLSAEEMAAYREPFPDPASRRPVWRWPNQIPLDGEPADVVALVDRYARWLGDGEVPKLLLTFEPGVLIQGPILEWCRTKIRALEIRHIGPGSHFVQEDHPREIGAAIREWRREAIAGLA
ncbi:MAG TPA: haloalkane dehalogenase [Candidatus Eisenbacteria bacterium]|nr:haloalkane dehalogenase [Candidatus Eisenbacteria bacterium]